MEQVIFWTATVLSFIGNTAFTLSSLVSRKKLAVGMQTSNHFLSTVAQLLQKAFSGMVQDVVCLFKNLILLFVPEGKKRLKIVISLICMAAGVGVGIALNVLLSDNVWYGYLPVFSSLMLSTTVLKGYVCELSPLKRLLIMKGGLMLNAVAWATYGIFIRLYPVTIFNCLTFVLSLITIIRFFVVSRKKSGEDELQTEEKVSENQHS